MEYASVNYEMFSLFQLCEILAWIKFGQNNGEAVIGKTSKTSNIPGFFQIYCATSSIVALPV